MPRGDKTGPEGMGPMTGQRLGTCANNNARPRVGRGRGLGQGFGNGFGRGLGRRQGRGFGQGYGAVNSNYEMPLDTTTSPNQNALADEVANLKPQLTALEAQLSELLNKE